MNIENYFSIQVFFIILREVLESAIIVSVLLSFLRQSFTSTDAHGVVTINIPELKYRGLQKQIWFGSALGLIICFVIGVCFVSIFYLIGNDLWSVTERLWEGIFSVCSSLMISAMGLSLLKVHNMTKKWKFKLSTLLKLKPVTKRSSFFSKFADKYALLLLPFVTTLREGLEAVVFIGGIGASAPLTSIPLSLFLGAFLGSLIGISLYKSGNKLSLHYFLILSTCFLYLIAAGLMSRGVWFLELEQYVRKCGIDPSETGSGPGSYDIAKSVWHVNCCNGLKDSYWMLLNAIFGWTNSATYGSVLSYNLYWIILVLFLNMKIYEEHHGYLPYVPLKMQLKRIKKRVLIYDSINDNKILLTNTRTGDTTPQEEGEEEVDLLLNTRNHR